MLLRISVQSGKPSQLEADLLLVPIAEGRKLAGALAAAAQQDIKAKLKQTGFTGSWGAAEIWPLATRGIKAGFVGVLGLGKPDISSNKRVEAVRRAISRAVAEAGKYQLPKVGVDLTGMSAVAQVAAAVVDGAELASYRFTEYAAKAGKEAKKKSIKQLILVVDEDKLPDVKRVVKAQQNLHVGTKLARDLVNRPASDVRPETLVDEAKRIARDSKAITLKVLNKRQAEAQNFNAFLAVAKGSTEEPYVIDLKYTPRLRQGFGGQADEPIKKIYLVGKGITFDSGGLSLKPAEHMEDMKIDMAGAATVLGLFATIEKLDLDVEVHGIIATCENMPSGEAYRPGDVLTAKNGKTIEVLNTDAEGRVTLADALSYAVEEGADSIIDIATLTGSCVVALGETYAGLWSTDNELAKGLLAAASGQGEGLVRLPLPEEYQQMLNSKVADMTNTATSRYGGATTAALFLREFVGETPWAHLDIAGPAYLSKQWLPYYQPGATGFGVRTLAKYLQGLGESSG